MSGHCKEKKTVSLPTINFETDFQWKRQSCTSWANALYTPAAPRSLGSVLEAVESYKKSVGSSKVEAESTSSTSSSSAAAAESEDAGPLPEQVRRSKKKKSTLLQAAPANKKRKKRQQQQQQDQSAGDTVPPQRDEPQKQKQRETAQSIESPTKKESPKPKQNEPKTKRKKNSKTSRANHVRSGRKEKKEKEEDHQEHSSVQTWTDFTIVSKTKQSRPKRKYVRVKDLKHVRFLKSAATNTMPLQSFFDASASSSSSSLSRSRGRQLCISKSIATAPSWGHQLRASCSSEVSKPKPLAKVKRKRGRPPKSKPKRAKDSEAGSSSSKSLSSSSSSSSQMSSYSSSSSSSSSPGDTGASDPVPSPPAQRQLHKARAEASPAPKKKKAKKKNISWKRTNSGRPKTVKLVQIGGKLMRMPYRQHVFKSNMYVILDRQKLEDSSCEAVLYDSLLSFYRRNPYALHMAFLLGEELHLVPLRVINFTLTQCAATMYVCKPRSPAEARLESEAVALGRKPCCAKENEKKIKIKEPGHDRSVIVSSYKVPSDSVVDLPARVDQFFPASSGGGGGQAPSFAQLTANLVDVSDDYSRNLVNYGKTKFDLCRRHKRVQFPMPDGTMWVTTLAQLNFMRWAYLTRLSDWHELRRERQLLKLQQHDHSQRVQRSWLNESPHTTSARLRREGKQVSYRYLVSMFHERMLVWEQDDAEHAKGLREMDCIMDSFADGGRAFPGFSALSIDAWLRRSEAHLVELTRSDTIVPDQIPLSAVQKIFAPRCKVSPGEASMLMFKGKYTINMLSI